MPDVHKELPSRVSVEPEGKSGLDWLFYSSHSIANLPVIPVYQCEKFGALKPRINEF
jgi:hypothetical protein